MYDILYIGAGASSLFGLAHVCSTSSLKVAVLEQNSKPALKLSVSGGGKCNVTNVDVQPRHFLANDEFIAPILKAFSKDDLLLFLKSHKIELELRKNRYYFCKNSSSDIINLLLKLSKKADFFYSEKALHVEKIDDKYFEIKTEHKTFKALHVVVGSGAISYKALGVSDIALQIASNFDLHVKQFQPALVGLTLQPQQAWMKSLSGVSFRVKIRVNDKVIDEEMLFAHRGISGLAILSASLYWHKGCIEIDFLPSFRVDEKILKSNKLLSSLLPVPKKFMKKFLEHIGISDKPCSKLSANELQKVQTIHSYSFAPAGNFGFDKAEVCRGGVDVSEFNSNDLMSKKVKNLYFSGEALDVTGELGGYNIQWAFSSGMVIANEIVKKDDNTCNES